MTPERPAAEIRHLHAERHAVHGAGRRRHVADGRAARAGRPHLAEERLRAAGLVRLLHRARRRPRAVVVRRAGPQGRRRARRHARRASTPRERHIFAHAFAVTGGLQCGFCIPGIVMARQAPARRNPRPTRAQIAEALNNHVCRCTGYVKIIDAIETRGAGAPGRAAAGGRLQRRDRHQPAPPGRRAVRARRAAVRRRHDAWTGMLHGAFLFSPHPRIRVRRIDTAEAARQPGVVRVVTAADVPGERYQGLIDKDWPIFVAEGETTHCIGDILAAVVADTERARAAGARAHPGRLRASCPACSRRRRPWRPARRACIPITTTCCRVGHRPRRRRRARSPRRRSSRHARSRRSCIEHAFLEPESCLAVPGLGLGTRGSGAGYGSRIPESRSPSP